MERLGVRCRCCRKLIPREVKEQSKLGWRLWRHLCVGCTNAAKRYALGPGEDDAIGFINTFLNAFNYGMLGDPS